jgi:hypothetical protein
LEDFFAMGRAPRSVVEIVQSSRVSASPSDPRSAIRSGTLPATRNILRSGVTMDTIGSSGLRNFPPGISPSTCSARRQALLLCAEASKGIASTATVPFAHTRRTQFPGRVPDSSA